MWFFSQTHQTYFRCWVVCWSPVGQFPFNIVMGSTPILYLPDVCSQPCLLFSNPFLLSAANPCLAVASWFAEQLSATPKQLGIVLRESLGNAGHTLVAEFKGLPCEQLGQWVVEGEYCFYQIHCIHFHTFLIKPTPNLGCQSLLNITKPLQTFPGLTQHLSSIPTLLESRREA
jgi:hypothetical protein